MPWYGWLVLLCVVIGPFDALYMYIKSQKRREALRKKRGEGAGEKGGGPERGRENRAGSLHDQDK